MSSITPNARPDFFGKDKFTPFLGVVEDVNDPKQSGRVKVRCVGWHPKQKKGGDGTDDDGLTTDDLPWAKVGMPTTHAQQSRIGGKHGLLPGCWVMGFFLDGEEAQDPFILSTFNFTANASEEDYRQIAQGVDGKFSDADQAFDKNEVSGKTQPNIDTRQYNEQSGRGYKAKSDPSGDVTNDDSDNPEIGQTSRQSAASYRRQVDPMKVGEQGNAEGQKYEVGIGDGLCGTIAHGRDDIQRRLTERMPSVFSRIKFGDAVWNRYTGAYMNVNGIMAQLALEFAGTLKSPSLSMKAHTERTVNRVKKGASLLAKPDRDGLLRQVIDDTTTKADDFFHAVYQEGMIDSMFDTVFGVLKSSDSAGSAGGGGGSAGNDGSSGRTTISNFEALCLADGIVTAVEDVATENISNALDEAFGGFTASTDAVGNVFGVINNSLDLYEDIIGHRLTNTGNLGIVDDVIDLVEGIEDFGSVPLLSNISGTFNKVGLKDEALDGALEVVNDLRGALDITNGSYLSFDVIDDLTAGLSEVLVQVNDFSGLLDTGGFLDETINKVVAQATDFALGSINGALDGALDFAKDSIAPVLDAFSFLEDTNNIVNIVKDAPPIIQFPLLQKSATVVDVFNNAGSRSQDYLTKEQGCRPNRVYNTELGSLKSLAGLASGSGGGRGSSRNDKSPGNLDFSNVGYGGHPQNGPRPNVLSIPCSGALDIVVPSVPVDRDNAVMAYRPGGPIIIPADESDGEKDGTFPVDWTRVTFKPAGRGAKLNGVSLPSGEPESADLFDKGMTNVVVITEPGKQYDFINPVVPEKRFPSVYIPGYNGTPVPVVDPGTGELVAVITNPRSYSDREVNPPVTIFPDSNGVGILTDDPNFDIVIDGVFIENTGFDYEDPEFVVIDRDTGEESGKVEVTILDGRIVNVEVSDAGSDFRRIPEIVEVGLDPGYGTVLRPIMTAIPKGEAKLPRAIEVVYCPAKNQQNYTN